MGSSGRFVGNCSTSMDGCDVRHFHLEIGHCKQIVKLCYSKNFTSYHPSVLNPSPYSVDSIAIISHYLPAALSIAEVALHFFNEMLIYNRVLLYDYKSKCR